MQNNLFKRNRKKTLIIFTLAITIFFDLLAGLLFIPKDHNSYRAPHYYYHHGLLPNQKTTAQWGARQYPFYTNSLGFRDHSTKNVVLRTSKHRILFMGDSFTEGTGVTYDESFVGIISNNLSAREIEVLNAGVASYSPAIYFHKTKYLLENMGLRFNQLIVFIDIGDIINEVTLYRNFEPAANGPKENVTYRAHRYLKNRSFMYYFASRLDTNQERENAVPNRNLLGEAQSQRTLNEQMANAINHKEGTWTLNTEIFEKVGRYGVKAAKYYMKALLLLCRKNNIKLTIAVYPWPLQIYSRDLNSLHVRIWREFSQINGIGFINLFPEFINHNLTHDESYNRYFIFGDIHWNPTGHRIVANKVLTYIQGG